ncbi:hypothetical protein [Streptomyces sp. NPDC056160]|uniref:hypothetical protein n=1 Tax=Streptomyces sp. NPDC056160 TaxID=3345731 RepID=UPI0035D66ECB
MHRDKDQPSRFSGGLSTEDLAQQPSGAPAPTDAEQGTAARRPPVFPGESTGGTTGEQAPGRRPGTTGTPTADRGDTAADTAGTPDTVRAPDTATTPDMPGTSDPVRASDMSGTADTAAPAGTGGTPQAAGTRGTPTTSTDDAEGAPRLLSEEDEQGFRERWGETQSQFVDDPREAVHTADTLVADVMQTLAATFARHKQELEGQWSQGEQVDTEELRKALRRYRSFFNRLLST